MKAEVRPIRTPWPGMTSARDRFSAQMHGRATDRCFNMEFGYWQENFATWRGFRENGITTNAEADRFFAFDRIETIGGNTWMSPPFEETVVSQTSTTRTLVNEDGLFAEVPIDGHSTIPHFTRSSVSNPDDWRRVKRERFQVDDPARRIDLARLKRMHPDSRDYPLGVSTGSMIGKIRDMLTFEGLAYAVYDYPEMVEDMVETACLLVEESLRQLLPAFRFDFAAGWEDIAFKNGPIVSPDFFQRVVVPRYRRIRDLLESAGVDLWYTDCDGDIRVLIPAFLAGGINCMFPFEVNSSGHPGAVLDEYGSDLAILGGVDKRVLIAGPTETRGYLESLAPYVERGRFIPFCDHRCPPDVTYENYLAYLDMKAELFADKG